MRSLRGGPVVRLKSSDLPRVTDLCVACREFYELIEGQPATEATAAEILGPLEAAYAHGTKHVWGVEAPDGALMSIVELLEGHPTPQAWYIGLLLVAPERRRQGLGSEACRALLEWLALRGATTVRVVVHLENDIARAFWERQGFVLEREVSKRSGRLEGRVGIFIQDVAEDRVAVEPLEERHFNRFIDYLRDQASENGSEETGYFQPTSRHESSLPPDKVEAFRVGLRTNVPLPGWRRVWVARRHERFVGHVDLKARSESFTAHRCVLGLGVDREHRRGGLGQRLLAAATAWAIETATLAWMDLEVMSTNVAARRLYEKAGFDLIGEVADLFRVDGVSLAPRIMTKRLRDTRDHQQGA